MATVTAWYANAALLGARRLGYDTQHWLQQANIDSQQLGPEQRVGDDQLSQLIRIAWKAMNDEFLGCTAAPCPRGAFAMMCEVAAQADTIEAAFTQGIRFYQLVSTDIDMHFEHQGEHCRFDVAMRVPALDQSHFFLEFWLVIWHRFMSWLCGQQIKLQTVHFNYPQPAHAKEFKHQFNCHAQFNQSSTCFVFPSRYARQSPIRTHREVAQFVKQSPAMLMTIPEEDGSYTRQVKTLLQEAIAQLAIPAMEQVCEQLAISPQTLRRRLHQEGSSYNDIKNRLLCDTAIEGLLLHKQDIDTVAQTLGFGESSSFIRAFKRWTGQTPQQYLRARANTTP